MPWNPFRSKRVTQLNVTLHDVWVAAHNARTHSAGSHSMLSNLTHDLAAARTDLSNLADDVRAIAADLKALRDNASSAPRLPAADQEPLWDNESSAGGTV